MGSRKPNGAHRRAALIGEAFRVAREDKGLTSGELARRSAIAESRLAEIEAGEGELASLIMPRLIEVLEYDLDYRRRGEDPEFKALGAMYKRLRQAHGFSLAELASRSGVSEGSIRRIEQGLGNPRYGTTYRLAQALGSDCSSLSYAARLFERAGVEQP